jgi:hypothetical protein
VHHQFDKAPLSFEGLEGLPLVARVVRQLHRLEDVVARISRNVARTFLLLLLEEILSAGMTVHFFLI